MNRLNRRRFLALGAASTASVVLVACGNESPSEENLNPTQIPDVAGAPPTLAPITSTPQTEAGGGESGGESGGSTGGGAATAVDVSAVDIGFEPKELTIAADTDVTISFVNNGMLQHDFVIEGTDFATALHNGGESEDLVVNLPEGEYVYFCSVPGHREAGMEGTLTVTAGGGEAAAEEAPAEEAAAGSAPATAVDVSAVDIGFEPKELTIAADTDVTISFVNNGMLQHDFVIEGTDFATALHNGGESEDLVVNLPEGEYVYFCSVPGHREAGMEGTLTVTAGGGEAAAGEAPAEEATAEEAPAEEAPAEEAAAGATDGGAATGEAITIAALDSMAFDPNEVEVTPGQTLTLRNDGFLQHDLAVDDWGGALTELLNGGDSQEFTIPEDAAVGESFEFYCSVPGHMQAGMTGTFTIVEAGAAGAAAPAAEEESTPEDDAEGEAAASTPASEAASGDASDPMNVEIVATEWEFSPAEFEVAPGGTITLVNEGTVAHAMKADAFGGAFLETGAGQTATFTVPADAEVGETIEFTAVNSNATSLGMAGTITIVEGTGAAASPAASPVASPMASPAASESGSGSGDAVEMSAVDLAFEPKELTIAADTDVTISFVNNGMLQHDFVIEDTDFATALHNGGESEDLVVNLAAGEYTFYCSVPGHREAGMQGTLTVE